MKRFFKGFTYAWDGIVAVFKSETNMKVHVSIAIAVIILGFLFRISQMEWLAILICIGLVFSSEIFNTAFETLVNKVSPEQDPLAGKTKDIAAGAVLVNAIISVVVGVIIFLPKLVLFILLLFR